MGSLSKKPHAICIPFPAQGHINPMFKVAKLLHHKGFHITFVHTEYNYKRLLRSIGSHSLDGLPDFRFETIPDGLPPADDDANSTQDVPSLCDSTRKNCLVPFRELLLKLDQDKEVPPVTCIVSDGIMSFTLEAAKEIGVPNVLFWTTSACGFMAYTQYANLIERGLVPLKDESYLTNGYLETIVDWIPGMKNIRLKDIPTFIRTTDPNELLIDFVIEETTRASEGSAIILNTFDALESEVLLALSAMFPRIYSIGPLQILLNQIPPNLKINLNSNLWKEDAECLTWLDSKKPNSVVYVNFGSVTVMTPDQLAEFAWGLANSEHTFLWIIRPDLVAGESAISDLTDFQIETKGRGLMVSWCPQEEVLNHPAIGGFLTHNGWNSTIESICGGVPMVCWPFFAEQQTNCRYVCNEWGIGTEIDSDVRREKVEKLVRELMANKEMKKKVMEWKKMAGEESVGLSKLNFDKMVEEVLLSKPMT